MIINDELAVLTRAGSKYGISFLNMLIKENLRPRLICIEKVTFNKRFKMAKFLSTKIGLFDSIRYNLKFWIKPLVRALTFGYLYPYPDYNKFSDNVVNVQDINSDLVVSALKNNNISKVILAQSGIIRKPIIKLKNKWIINCHSGKTPMYRGVDCVRWSLFNGDEVYVTLHLIDSGIDTGKIIEQVKVPIYNDDTIKNIQARADEICIKQLLKSVTMPEKVFRQAREVKKPRGKQYYLMPFKKVNQLMSKEREIISSFARIKN